MMKKYILLAFLLLVVVAVSGCIGTQNTGSGNVINQTKNVSGFNQVLLNGTGTLVITQGDKESLTVEAEDNVISHINTEANNNQLNISFQGNVPLPTKPIKYYLTVKDLKSIDIQGAGQIESGGLKTDNLTMKVNGAAQGNITNLNVNLLTIIIEGAGRINLAGNANNQTINISGAGNYNAGNLTSRTATISINGGSRTTLRVSDLLNVIINGGGDISYIGNPKVTQQINGGGNIKQITG